MPSPIAWADAAQAVTGAPSGPLKPYWIEIQPAAMLARKLGTVNGDSRRGPLSRIVSTASAITGEPPTPEPMIVAVAAFSSAVVGHPARLRQRLGGGDEAVLDEDVHLLDFLEVDDRLGIEAVGRALGRHQPGDLAGEIGGVEPVVDDDAALARDQRRPVGGDADAQRRHGAHAGDDDRIGFASWLVS